MACRFFLLVLVLATLGCGQKNEYQPPPPPEVVVAHPTPAVVPGAIDLTGVTTPSEQVAIRARVEGFLEEVLFTEGELVEKDQPLFVIDPKPFQADVDAAEAALAVANAQKMSAEASLKQAQAQTANDEAQYKRADRASQSGAVTESELDELWTAYQNSLASIKVAEASIASAQAEIEAATATLEQAKLDLGYTQVSSPLAGRVGMREVDIGNLVGSGESTVLTKVIRYDPIYAEFTISERQLLEFIRRAQNEGRAVPATSENNQRVIRLGLADEEGYPHQGVFEYADLSVDQASGTYLVRATFENSDRVIPPGAYVRIRVVLEDEQCMLVPDAALSRGPQGEYVLVVSSDGTVQRKPVKTGRLHEGQRMILDGLSEQDRVIVAGLQKARPGGQVTVKPDADTPAQGEPPA